MEQVVYLIKKMIESGRKFIGFDLDEIAIGESNFDANVGARILWKLCNILVAANPLPLTRKEEECTTTL